MINEEKSTRRREVTPSGRKRPVRLSPQRWQDARVLFETQNVPAAEIALRLNVVTQTVLRRVRRDGWVRSDVLRELVDAGDTHGLARLIGRLARAFEHQIAAVEAQLRGRGTTPLAMQPDDPGTLERNARTLGSLAKTLDTLIELRAGVADLKPSGDDEDALRRELADRLDRLCQQGEAAGLSGAARSSATELPAS